MIQKTSQRTCLSSHLSIEEIFFNLILYFFMKLKISFIIDITIPLNSTYYQKLIQYNNTFLLKDDRWT